VSGSENTVSGFSVQPDGSLAPVPGSPYRTANPNFSVAADPNGKYLYVAALGNSGTSIQAFSIDQSSGALTPLAGSPFQLPPPSCQYCSNFNTIQDMAIDRSGKFLIAPGWENGVVYVEQIDPSTAQLPMCRDRLLSTITRRAFQVPPLSP
jgi:6-phosphogluconolactonase (cycloisomerase 2 family)